METLGMTCVSIATRVTAVWVFTWMCTLPFAAIAAEKPAAPSAPTIEAPIAVQSESGSDAKIRARLTQLLSALEGLGKVDVRVSSGVVALSGEVPTQAAREKLMSIVRRVEGVAEVRSDVKVSRDVLTRLGLLQDRFMTKMLDIVAYLPLVLVAIVVLLAFWWLSAFAAKSDLLLRYFGQNPFIRDLVRQAVRLAILALGVLLALEVLDASTLFASLLGAAGVVGLAVGFALRDTVENYIASLLLSLRQPFARNDLVAVDGLEGRVMRLNSRATVLLTPDGNHLRIPNAKVYKAVILNYTRNCKRRFQFDVGVDAQQNLAAAQRLAVETLTGMDGIESRPLPACTVETLGESDVVLRVFAWVDQSRSDFANVRSEAIRLVKGAFDRSGIVMPEPIYNVHIDRLPRGTNARGSSAAGLVTVKEPASEPKRAIDVERRDERARQVEEVRRHDEEDLLHPDAAKE
jgi:small-conductance mechanosensitive channel